MICAIPLYSPMYGILPADTGCLGCVEDQEGRALEHLAEAPQDHANVARSLQEQPVPAQTEAQADRKPLGTISCSSLGLHESVSGPELYIGKGLGRTSPLLLHLSMRSSSIQVHPLQDAYCRNAYRQRHTSALLSCTMK